jgi:hypothetical protein
MNRLPTVPVRLDAIEPVDLIRGGEGPLKQDPSLEEIAQRAADLRSRWDPRRLNGETPQMEMIEQPDPRRTLR